MPLERPRSTMRLAMRRRTAIMVAGLATVGGIAFGVQQAWFSGGATARPELQAILTESVTGVTKIAPGATAYVSGPKGTWLGSAGVENVKTNARMPADARFRLESVSKIWTATLIMQLQHDGKLHVSDTVEQWLPGLLPYGSKIDIRELMTMRSGLIDNNDFMSSNVAAERYLNHVKDPKLRKQLLSIAARFSEDPAIDLNPIWWIRWAAWQPLLFKPNTNFHYSNIGYEILGLIAVKAGGAPLQTLFADHIFKPLRLHDTAYDPRGPISGPHATGYWMSADRETLTDTTAQHLGVGAEGGIVSNAKDTATFLVALMKGKLLPLADVSSMRGENLWYGGSDSPCAGRAFGWSGGGNGYKTNVWVNRDGSRVAVLLFNARIANDAGDAAAQSAMSALYCAA